MDKTLHQGRRSFWQSIDWHKVGSVCAAVSGQGCGLGMVLEAAEIKPLKFLALRPGTKGSASEGSIAAGRKEGT